MISENIKLMNEKIVNVRATYPNVAFEEPGYDDTIQCDSLNFENRKLHNKCMVDSIDYALNSNSGNYSIKACTGSGKSFTAIKQICTKIKDGASPNDFCILGINENLSALDNIIEECPSLEVYANALRGRYITYQKLAINFDEVTGTLSSDLYDYFKNAKYIIADEAHRIASEKCSKVCDLLLKDFKDDHVFLFLSTVVYRWDDPINCDYMNNLLHTNVLYSIARLDAYALGILLPPYHFRILTCIEKRDILIQVANEFNMFKSVESINNMSDDEIDDLYSSLSSKHLVSSYIDLVDKCYPILVKEGVLHKKKITAIALFDTIAGIDSKMKPIESFFRDLAKVVGKELVFEYRLYACNQDTETSRVNLHNFSDKDSFLGGDIDDSKLTVDVLAGVHAISQSIHPDCDMMFVESNIKANVKREQSGGRVDSFSRINKAIVVDFYNTLENGLKGLINFGEDGDDDRATSSSIFFKDVNGSPDIIRSLVKCEIGALSVDELSSLTELALSGYYCFSDYTNINNICNDIGKRYNLSNPTVKIFLYDLGLLNIKFLTYQEAVKLFNSVILNKLLNNLGQYKCVGVDSYEFESGDVITLNSCITINNNVTPICRDKLSIFNKSVLDSVECEKYFNEVASSLVAML